MQQRRAMLLLEAEQAEARAVLADAQATAAREAWSQRLTKAGLPDLEPVRLVGWLADRDGAEAAHRASMDAEEEAQEVHRRRDEARARLSASLENHPDAPTEEGLAPVLAFAERIRRQGEEAQQKLVLGRAALEQIEQDLEDLSSRRKRLGEAMDARASDWKRAVEEAGIALDIANAAGALDVLEELRVAVAGQEELNARVNAINRDARDHAARVEAAASAFGITEGNDAAERLGLMRARLAAARTAADVQETLEEGLAGRRAEAAEAEAKLAAVEVSLQPLLEETGSTDWLELASAIGRSREARKLSEAVASAETSIVADGDGYSLEDLLNEIDGVNLDGLAAHTESLNAELVRLNTDVAAAATAHGDAKRAFAELATDDAAAVDAATDAEQARSELGILADHYILKRAQVITLKWSIEQYRERHQDPMLLRASALFSELTIGRYTALKIDAEGSAPRLLGLRDDGRTVVEVGAMSEGTTDQLFLALRLAAVEQSVAAGIRLPFLADDLFVNFDDERSEAGFRVLAELARSTQVLFFTHHPHLATIARSVVGADLHSECSLARR